MFKISSLLEIHDRNGADAKCLDNNLFDSYLYGHNKVFRNIRDVCLMKGYRFSSSGGQEWMDYRACHLVSLPTIIETKTIPYLDNVSFMRRLLAKKLDIEIDLPFMTSALTRNPLFHESGHCVSYDVVFKKGEVLRSPEEKAFGHLIAEAYAFVIFYFCAAEANSSEEILGCILNDIAIITSEKIAFKNSVEKFGEKATMGIYMLSNICCLGQVPRRLVPRRRVAELCGITESMSDCTEFQEIVNCGFNVVTGFVGGTQDVYYSLLGTPRPNFETVTKVLAAPSFANYFASVMDDLYKIIIEGIGTANSTMTPKDQYESMEFI